MSPHIITITFPSGNTGYLVGPGRIGFVRSDAQVFETKADALWELSNTWQHPQDTYAVEEI